MTNRVLKIFLASIPVALALADTAKAQSPTAPNPSVCQRQLAPVLTRLFRKDCADITSQDLAGITELHLPGVRIRNWGPGELQGFDNLKILEVKNDNHSSGILTVEDNAFASLKKLEKLDLHTEGVPELSPRALWGLESLKELTLMPFKMANNTLPGSWIKDSPLLEGVLLDVRATPQLILEDDVFQPARNSLKTLLFYSYYRLCAFDRLPAAAFRSLTKLQNLSLTCKILSPLTRADDAFFRDLKSLDWLELEGEHTIDAMPLLPPSLKRIKLDRVTMNSALPDLFSGLRNLENVEIVPTSRQAPLSSRVFENLNSLKEIAIRWGHFDAFPWLPRSLQRLSLATTFGSPMDPLSFRNLVDLNSVGLHDPTIGPLPKELFKGLHKIQTVSFSGCDLREIPHDFFDQLPQCDFSPNGGKLGCTFDFSRNQITGFFPRMFSKVLGDINLSKNPVLGNSSEMNRIRQECPDCTFRTDSY